MTKMNWDKVNRAKSGASYGGSVVSYVSKKPDTRPICTYYSISRKNNKRTCGNRVSTEQGHNGEFCEDHQGYVLHSKERGWFPSTEMTAKTKSERRAQKEHEKKERILAYEMERRYRRRHG